jgi:hypothetical protein
MTGRLGADPRHIRSSVKVHHLATQKRDLRLPNNSLERTQPQREFIYDVAVLRRSARDR